MMGADPDRVVVKRIRIIGGQGMSVGRRVREIGERVAREGVCMYLIRY